MTAEEVLIELKDVAEFDLEDICNCKETDEPMIGLKMLYIEILEIIQLWDGAKTIGLDYDIESRYQV